MTAIRSLDTQINRHSDIVHWYAEWGDQGSGAFSANQPWMLNAVRNYSSVGNTGSTPLITWEAWGPAPYTVAHNTFPLKNVAAGSYDAYIDSWAIGLRGYGGTVMLDVFHEMDGDWYPWGYGVNGNTPADYIAAYRHVHDRFALAGATNVQFVWNPNYWNAAGIDQRVFYPGDAYVDWLAIDAYNWGAGGGTWQSLAQALSDAQIYSKMLSLNATKPMMLAEWASVEPIAGDPAGVSKGQWVMDASQALASQYPRIKALVWFSEAGTPFAIESSSSSIAGTRAAFGGCSTPPPPPPPPPSPKPSPVASPVASPSPTPTRPPSPRPSPTTGSSPSPSAPATRSPTPPAPATHSPTPPASATHSPSPPAPATHSPSPAPPAAAPPAAAPPAAAPPAAAPIARPKTPQQPAPPPAGAKGGQKAPAAPPGSAPKSAPVSGSPPTARLTALVSNDASSRVAVDAFVIAVVMFVAFAGLRAVSSLLKLSRGRRRRP